MNKTKRFDVLFSLCITVVLCACERDMPAENAIVSPEAKPLPDPIFEDVAGAVGIEFQHFLGATGDYYFPEIAGSGVALFDYDVDGDLDLYAVQGAMLESGRSPKTSTLPPPEKGFPPVNRLFRNDLIPNGVLGFVDVTQESGLGDTGYGMGVAVGDTDNDGDPDVFVSNVGENSFYVNNGDGTFERIESGLSSGAKRWTTSASFLDVDQDGDLDLFATDYVDFNVANNVKCSGSKGQREYCDPTIYPPLTDHLWRNDGGNRFTDISEESGIGSAAGNGLGSAVADFDNDGDLDIYVANDQQANRLWAQQSGGTFEDTATMTGSAFNANGMAEASMGVTAGDFDADGDEDLFMTHLTSETNTLYVNNGSGSFTDYTQRANLANSSLRLTGFGTRWFDYDNDGSLDLFIANGAVLKLLREDVDPAFPFGQRNQLLRNERGRFVEVSTDAGAAMQLVETSRGAAFGDVDNDGDIDIAVSNGNGPIRLLINRVGNRKHWLTVRLAGTKSNRDGAGARLVLRRPDGRATWRRAHTDGSYLSASDIRVHFGLGDDDAIESLGIIWPGGNREIWRDLQADTIVMLTEGGGEAWLPETAERE